MPSAGIRALRLLSPRPHKQSHRAHTSRASGASQENRRPNMKRSITVGLAMVAGAALGAAAVEGLHAQAKPPVYQIVEIDVLNQDAYVNDYAPKAQAAIKAAGGKFLAAGGKTTAIEGDPP